MPKGGRPAGVSGHRNDGLQKRCRCARRRWSECKHPWYFNFRFQEKSYRFNLNKLAKEHELSRTEAETWRDRLRSQIRDGSFAPSAPAPDPAGTKLTFRDVATKYEEEFRLDPNRRRHRADRLKLQLDLICRTMLPAANGTTIPMGDKPFEEFRTPDMEAFREARRRVLQSNEDARKVRAAKLADGDTTARKLPVSPEVPHSRRGEIGTNRNLELIRMLFNWAIAKFYYDRENPFRRHGQRVMAFAKEQARTRRLQPDEEAALLRCSGPHLQALIIAAIETGARKGELLALQWRDLDRDARGRFQTIRLRPESTKTDKPAQSPSAPGYARCWRCGASAQTANRYR